MRLTTLLFTLCLCTLANVSRADYRVETLSTALAQPWAMSWLNHHSLVITEKGGSLKRFDLDTGQLSAIAGAPPSRVHGQGGLLDVLADPNFHANQLLYFSYTKALKRGYSTAVARARLQGDQLVEHEELISIQAQANGGRHFGSRLAFDQHGLLYITVGDRGQRNRAQQLDSHAGKVLRIHRDGRIPADNPFVNTAKALPEIYSYGHRNPQGLYFDPPSKTLWLHEHGPKGGDEINRVQAGGNYGWPILTYGREYSGLKITDERSRPGMVDSHWQWTPSIAPSGLIVYHGAHFPHWQGNLLVGALKDRALYRLVLQQGRIIEQQRLLAEQKLRLRALEVDPQGRIYLLSDEGKLLRIRAR